MSHPRLTAEGVTYRSPDGVLVLDGLRLFVDAGEVVDITGPSGSGKTTLVRALARLLPGAEGVLALNGEDAGAIPPQLWRSRVALLPQVPAIVRGSVRDNLLLPWRLKVRTGATPPGDPELQTALASLGLGGDIVLTRDAARLSVGQAARIALLRVMLIEPDVLLFDEPDAALDDESAGHVAAATAALAARGAGVVRVRHRRSDSVAARRLRLADGHLTEVTV